MNRITETLDQAVAALLRQVARDVVLPRYQNLAAHEVEEKAADDLVTIADKESELRLNDGLSRILPEAGLIGEEACAADPAIVDRLSNGLHWIIDPIDGTGNFAAGRPPFGIMVALADNGATLAGWILDPLTDRLCNAVLDSGAFINGERVTARGSGEALPIAGISTLYMNSKEREIFMDRAQGRLRLVDIPRCAAEQYPRLVLGQNDISLFERTLPWDHAAGVLLLNEAGGRCCRMDGSPYRVGDDRRGMLAASTPAIWDEAARILLA